MDKLQKQLDHMLKDTRYWRPKDTFKDFVNDIFCKVRAGKTLSHKQKKIINTAVKRYSKFYHRQKNPDFREKTDKLVSKIELVTKTLMMCGYTMDYEHDAKRFLDSVKKQARRSGTISEKQVSALNKMYKRFLKRVQKIA